MISKKEIKIVEKYLTLYIHTKEKNLFNNTILDFMWFINIIKLTKWNEYIELNDNFELNKKKL